MTQRQRAIALAAVAATGLAVAFWLPTRSDSASATENGQRASSNWRHDRHNGNRDWWRHNGGWSDRSAEPSASASEEPSAEPTATDVPTDPPTDLPTEVPTSEVPTTEPTTVPPTTEPTAEPTTEAPTTPPTTAPTTTPPTTAPTTSAPKAKAWAPFTIYLPGQIVSFQGVNYKVLAAHTSLPGWEPTKLPLLFKVIS